MAVFQLSIDASGVVRGSRLASNALQGVSQQARHTQRSILDLSSIAQKALAGFSVYKIIQQFSELEKTGIQFNDTWESSRLAIASTIGAVSTFKTAQGEMLEGSQKFVASQAEAEKIMQRIQILGLQTTATTQELVQGVQGLISPAMRFGVEIEKIPDLAVNIAQAMGSMKLPLEQMRTESEALLSGNINKAQHLLASNLGITGEMVRSWQKQGVLIDEIMKRLESFKLSGEAIADTWGGLTSNLKEYVEFTAGKSTTGLFDGMKDSVRELQRLMVELDNTGGVKLSDNIVNLVYEFGKLNDFLGDKFLSATKTFVEYVGELNDPETLSVLENRLGAVASLGGAAFGAISNIAGVVGDISGMTLDVLDNIVPAGLKDDSDALTSSLTALAGGYLGLSAVRKVASSAALQNVVGLSNELGVRGALNQSILSGNEALTRQTGAISRSANASLAEARTNVTRISQARQLAVANEDHAQRLVRLYSGTQNSERAERVLAAQRSRLVGINAQLATAENTLAAAQVRAATASRGLSTAQIALEGTKKAAMGLVGFLGGPLGAAFTVAAGTAFYLASQESLAEQVARDHAEALRVVSSGADEASESMQTLTDKINNMTRIEIKVDIDKAQDKIEEFKNNFIDYKLYSSFVFTSDNEVDKRIGAILKSFKELNDYSSASLKRLKDELSALGEKSKLSGGILDFINDKIEPLEALALKLEKLSSRQQQLNESLQQMDGTPFTLVSSQVDEMMVRFQLAMGEIDGTKRALEGLDKLTVRPTIEFTYQGQQPDSWLADTAGQGQKNLFLSPDWLKEQQGKRSQGKVPEIIESNEVAGMRTIEA